MIHPSTTGIRASSSRPTARSAAGPRLQAIKNLGNAQPANPFLFRDNQYVTGANLSWNKGKHAFRGGIEWNHTQIESFPAAGRHVPAAAWRVRSSTATSLLLQGLDPNVVQLLG